MDKRKESLIRTGGSLSWEERENMIKEYLTGHYTKVELWRKYTGQEEEHGQILRWMRTLGYISNKNTIERKKKFLPSLIQPAQILTTENNNQSPLELFTSSSLKRSVTSA